MGKKKSYQDVKVPRPLDVVETRLYGWVEEAVLTQLSLVESDSLLEFRRNFPLMEDSGVEGDYVLEAAGPSDRVPFRADEDDPHFLWVYQELFTRLRMRLPFSDFQRDVMTCCRVAVSQLHLNGWSFILAFEKVLAAPGKRAFWLDHENKPFSWVYWNPEVKDFAVYNLEPLEMAAFKFLVSLSSGLPKRNNFTCRWILDGSNTEVGKFLDDLLDVKMKRTKLDDLMAKMADPSRMRPRAVLPIVSPSATATAAAAVAAASASAAAGPTPARSSSQVPPVPTASETHRLKKQSSKRPKVVNLEDEEGLQEDPAADLQKKRRRKKIKVDEAFERALGEDSAWEHDVDPLKVDFSESFDYRKALNAGLTSAPVREALNKMSSEQLLGQSYHLSAQSLAFLQHVCVETALAAKVKAEKELSAALDQIEVLKGERDSALLYLPLKEKVDTLDDELSERTAEYRFALDRIALLEEDNRVLKTQFESSQLSLEGERKRSKAVEKQVVSLTSSLKISQAELSKAVEASEYWRAEWQQLGSEVTVMCQETLEICLDQVSHLCPGVDFSAITLKSRWDPKGRRIFVPRESDVEEELPQAEEVVPEQDPGVATQTSQPAAGDVVGGSGERPTENL
ncbi:hypothetical protein PIB30_003658 [Stylosanthes scabra]|uniref:Transposase (Putative), gypsy type n=1 Tax=Stylosanthes scabra TaxID=79078 RepID=A0ABU6Z067_9FABA|nr:hypothetical protein [Stylosanthes scabra]